MNQPVAYRSANEAQRHDAEEVIKEYFSKINWRSDGKDSLIDIGSGSGDVLFDFIYPRLTGNFEKIVCSDVNHNMVECARTSYSAKEKCYFIVFNIETDKDLPVTLRAKFDHVTSFYCFHWIRNQRRYCQVAMHEPELYHKAHKEVKLVAGHIIRDHFSKVQWRPDGCDTLMDVGSGSGDVLMEYIYPLMPQSFHKIVCSDISQEMIEFLRRNNRNHNKFEYRILDIESKMEMPNDLRGTIDHLTSIYVLHWIRDIEASVKNMYDLLRSNGGDCLIVFFPQNTFFDAYDYMRNTTKWLDYKKIIERFIPPIYYSKDPKDDFRNLLKKAGFSDVKVNMKTELCSYESLQNFKENLKSVCAVLEYITIPALQLDFVDDLAAVILKLVSKSEKFSETDSKYCMQFEVLAASARKT